MIELTKLSGLLIVVSHSERCRISELNVEHCVFSVFRLSETATCRLFQFIYTVAQKRLATVSHKVPNILQGSVATLLMCVVGQMKLVNQYLAKLKTQT